VRRVMNRQASGPSNIRSGIYLSGEPTCEFDIRACHLRLLCAAARIDLGDADPYVDILQDDGNLSSNRRSMRGGVARPRP
jgi:hypothetical protein